MNTMFYASIKREALRMQEELRTAKENSRIAEARRGVAELQAKRAAKKAAKDSERKKWWERYHEQLGKGNSNIGNGAKHSSNRRARANKIC